jgi:hypothetical protein
MSSTNTNALENYEYIKCLPIVNRLIKENKKNKKEKQGFEEVD